MCYKIRHWCIALLCATLLLVMPIAIQAEENSHLQFTIPSEQETMVAKDRSFYVKANFNDIQPLNENSYMRIEIINDQNQSVRSLQSLKKKDIRLKVSDTFPTFYSPITKADVEKSGMPDLIWDGSTEESYLNGNNKCYFDDNGFMALIYVPNTSMVDELNFNDAGQPYDALEEGNYQIEATLYDENDQVITSDKTNITIGNTANKVLSRFSSNEHYERIVSFANENGYRIYADAFPGYFSKNDFFAEILSLWRAADAQEYTTGLVHFIIYNVKATSTTYSVELAKLQAMQDIDDATRLRNYYYAYGEPTLPDTTKSAIVAFTPNDKLQLTRAEITREQSEDNVYDKEQLSEQMQYDLDFKDGVKATEGEVVSVYGVSAPIQIDANDIEDAGKNAYRLHNKLASIHYTITGKDVNLSFEKEVQLNRKDKEWNNYSELEFKHTIPITKAMENKVLNVSLVGYDVHGNKVSGSEEHFQLDTRTHKSGVETWDTSSITLYFTLLLIGGVVVGLRCKKEA